MTGEELRRRRHALGMSQVRLAAALGISRRSVENWESGARAMRVPSLLDTSLRALEGDADADYQRFRDKQDVPAF